MEIRSRIRDHSRTLANIRDWAVSRTPHMPRNQGTLRNPAAMYARPSAVHRNVISKLRAMVRVLKSKNDELRAEIERIKGKNRQRASLVRTELRERSSVTSFSDGGLRELMDGVAERFPETTVLIAQMVGITKTDSIDRVKAVIRERGDNAVELRLSMLVSVLVRFVNQNDIPLFIRLLGVECYAFSITKKLRNVLVRLRLIPSRPVTVRYMHSLLPDDSIYSGKLYTVTYDNYQQIQQVYLQRGNSNYHMTKGIVWLIVLCNGDYQHYSQIRFDEMYQLVSSHLSIFYNPLPDPRMVAK